MVPLRVRVIATTCTAVLVAAACADTTDVSVEERVSPSRGSPTSDGTETSSPAPPVAPDTASAPTTTGASDTSSIDEPRPSTTIPPATATTAPVDDTETDDTSAAPRTDPVDDGDPVDDPDVLVFDLERFDVVARLRPTIADVPPTGYNGFGHAVEVPDGSLVATGFDASADGIQPERSALWTSRDGETWERSGYELGEPSGQQAVQSLYVQGDGTPSVVVADVAPVEDSDGTIDTEFGPAVEWSRSRDSSWSAHGAIGDVAIAGSLDPGAADGTVLYGVTDPNADGEFTASVFTRSGDAGWTTESIDVGADGAVVTGSVVTDLTIAGGRWIAVGGTTATDPLGNVPSEFTETLLSRGFTDVGIWTRPQAGGPWTRLDPDAFTGISDGALALAVESVGDTLFLLALTSEAHRPVPTLWRSDDLGASWEQVEFERAVEENLMSEFDVLFASLTLVEDYLVVTDEAFTIDGLESFVTIVDPSTNETVTHSVGERFDGLSQIESVIDHDGVGLAFGRIERGPNESDLQVLELMRSSDGQSSGAEDDVTDSRADV